MLRVCVVIEFPGEIEEAVKAFLFLIGNGRQNLERQQIFVREFCFVMKVSTSVWGLCTSVRNLTNILLLRF